MKISTEIQELFAINFKKEEEGNFLEDDLTLNWDKVNELLIKPSELMSDILQKLNYDNISSVIKNLDSHETCLELKRLIDPIIAESKIILKAKERFKASLNNFSTWTSSSDQLKIIFNEFCENPEEYALAGLLQITAILEFSLGNVYKSKTRQLPPHLLKDVLIEISQLDCFNEHQIILLQILVGSSKGINLRNVSWHGFIDSLDASYLTFLFVILISYGKQLQGKLMVVTRCRDDLVDWMISLDDANFNFSEIINAKLIQECNMPAWKMILKFYKSHNYTAGIFLILSQIEGILRYIYGVLNDEDVTAKLNKYYVIMDSMFYGYVLKSDITPLMIGKITKIQEMEIRRTSRRNKMLEAFPRSLILLHNDLFYCMDGPRIRDKISHGEVLINADNSRLILITLLIYTWHVAKIYEKSTNFTYQSIFMSSFKFVDSFNVSYEKLSQVFNSMEIPEAFSFEKLTVERLGISCEEIKISYLPLIEAQAVKLFLNILENYDKALENLQSSSSELFELLKLRKLSSGRRKMLGNLVQDLPTLAKGLQKVLNLIHKIFFIIQDLDDKFDNEKWSTALIKLLRQTLKLCENLSRYFSTQNRNFFVANQKVCEFLQFTDNCDSWLNKFEQ